MSDYFLFFNILVITIITGACGNADKGSDPADADQSNVIPFDDIRPGHWPEPFELVEIPSKLDSTIQQAWFYPTSERDPKPLLLSLHTWSGDFNQKDTLAIMALNEDWNYIHPDFRGPNWTVKACCSPYALDDIDAAIDFAMENGNVDTSRIYVNGVSGGGYAAVAVYMRSRHRINTISAWVPISDLEAWYEQSRIRGNKYASDIMQCTGSGDDGLDTDEAHRRSPIYWDVPDRNCNLYIFAGVYDGIQGSVPITHSINFYNKLVTDSGAHQNGHIVTVQEIAHLLEHRKPVGNTGKISNRQICLEKDYENIHLLIFEGNHEMLPGVPFDLFKN